MNDSCKFHFGFPAQIANQDVLIETQEGGRLAVMNELVDKKALKNWGQKCRAEGEVEIWKQRQSWHAVRSKWKLRW